MVLKNLSPSNEECLKDHLVQQVRKVTIHCVYKLVSWGLVFDQSGCGQEPCVGSRGYILHSGDGSSVFEGARCKPQQVAAGDQYTSLRTLFHIPSIAEMLSLLESQVPKTNLLATTAISVRTVSYDNAAVVQCVF